MWLFHHFVFVILSTIVCTSARQVSTNIVKEKIKQGEAVYGGFITIPSPKVVEMTMQSKLDFMWLEAEHTEWGHNEVLAMVIACENEAVVPAIRVPQNDVEVTKKYLGSGAPILIFPNIKSVEEATYAIASIKYPPMGTRRAGVERANGYLANFEQYIKRANDLTMAVLMVEEPTLVDVIDDVVKLPGLDVLHLGPYDLSLRMNVTMDSQEFAAAIEKVEMAAQKAHVPLGCAVNSLEDAQKAFLKGYRFFTIPGDMQMLQAGASEFFASPHNGHVN